MGTVTRGGISKFMIHRGSTMKHFITAVVIATLAVVASEARANNITANIGLVGGTATFDAIHTDSAPFIDTFNFAIDGAVLANASLVTIGFNSGQNIDFGTATLNGNPLWILGSGNVIHTWAVQPHGPVTTRSDGYHRSWGWDQCFLRRHN
jgi:hypothetical protein